MFAEWIKKRYNCLPSLFTFPNHSDLLSYFISIRILRREGSTVSVNGENAQLAQSHVIHSRLNSSQASWLCAQRSFPSACAASAAVGSDWAANISTPLWRPYCVGEAQTLRGTMAKGCSYSSTIGYCLEFSSWLTVPVKRTVYRVAWNSQDFFFKASPKVFLIEVQLIYNVVLISAVQQSDSIMYIYILL